MLQTSNEQKKNIQKQKENYFRLPLTQFSRCLSMHVPREQNTQVKKGKLEVKWRNNVQVQAGFCISFLLCSLTYFLPRRTPLISAHKENKNLNYQG